LAPNASPDEIVNRVLGSAPFNTGALNLSGHPALAVPNGVDEHGLPTSAQVIGRRFREDQVFQVGRLIESSTGSPSDQMALSRSGTIDRRQPSS
jgi:Asp-tRNA(Asn)/Glu-tRNA(Gln) amidotransferase A subunit family amidase